MPKLVNIVLPDGSVRAVPEDVAAASSYRRESGGEAADRVQLQDERRATSGFWQGAKAFGEGALDSLTLGLLGPEEGSMGALRAEHRPGARMAGQIAGVLPTLAAPGPGALGLVGKVARFTPAGAAAAAGRGAAAVVGGNGLRAALAAGAVEGAAQGAGAEIARARLSGDALTVESFVDGMGRGAMLGAGVAALGQSVLGLNDRARKAAVAAKARGEADDVLTARLADADAEVSRAYSEIDNIRLRRLEKQDLSTKAGRADAVSESQRALSEAQGAYVAAKGARDKLVDDLTDTRDRFAVMQREAEDVFVEVAALKERARGVYINSAQVVGEAQTAVAKAQPLLGKLRGTIADAPRVPTSDQDLTDLLSASVKTPGRPVDLDAVDKAHAVMQRAIEAGDVAGVAKAHKEYLRKVNYAAKRAGVEAPELPPPVSLVTDPALERALRMVPKDLLAYSKIRPESVATLNNVLSKHPAGVEVLERFKHLAQRLGVAEGTDFVSLHRHVADMAKVANPSASRIAHEEARARELFRSAEKRHNEVLREHDRLVKRANDAAQKEADRAAKIDLTKANARLRVAKEQRRAIEAEVKATRAAREAKGERFGGALHYVGGALGSGLAGKFGGGPVSRAAAWFAGSRVADGRTAFLGRIRDTVNRALASGIARKTGRGIKVLAPVTESLRVTLQGLPDGERDLRKAAMNRSREISMLAESIRDTSYTLLRDAAADNPEFIHALHNNFAGAVEYLAKYVPQDTGAARKLGSSQFVPSDDQARALATLLHVYHEPLKAFERLLSGYTDPMTSDALWALNPGMMKAGAIEVQSFVERNASKLSPAQITGLSLAFRVPMDSLLDRHNVEYLMRLDATNNLATGAGGGQQSNPNGRPPAAPVKSGGTMTQQLTT